jgi:hypothetical protein
MSVPEYRRRQDARLARLRDQYAAEIAAVDALEDERLLRAVWGWAA